MFSIATILFFALCLLTQSEILGYIFLIYCGAIGVFSMRHVLRGYRKENKNAGNHE